MNLQIQHIAKKFHNGTKALIDVDFRVSQGEFVSVIGPSGAGKTTLFRILNGMMECTGGQVLLDGMRFDSLKGRKKRELLKSIATIYQDFCLVENSTCLKNVLTAGILLGFMILPTIIEVSEAQIRAVPNSYYEGSLALGATHERSVYFAMLPAAKSGIMAGVILGIGRAIGETMAVVMIAGNQAVLPKSLVSGVRTMTANIVLEMGYATDLHREALIATGVVLFVFILVINVCFSLVKKGRD